MKMSAKMDEDEDGNTGSGVAIVETNRFGFILGNGETDSDAPCPELVRHRETKWLGLIKQWEQVMEKKSKQVKGQCQKGIPASVRVKCWPLLCGATDRMKNNEKLYVRLVDAPDQQGWTEIIKRDTDRQFPFHEMFQSKDGHGQKDLLDVLKAYTQYRPEEGYCQGQGPVAAVLLMNMPAEEAFWCLAQISEHYLPGYYSPLLEGVLFDAAILSGVLKKLCPAAHKHLHKQGVEPLMFATDWLMCLYSRHLPFNTLLRVWDLFFCYGVRVLFQVAVVLVRRCLGEGRQRKECDGQMETLERLRGVKERVQNDQTDAFIHEVCSVPLSLTDLQKQTDKEMEKWKKERPDSTFDPRGRCHGYRMAWGKVQNKQKENEKTDRQKGSLTLPVMRSHSSLSPLLHKKWRKRGCRTDTEEWDGGGRKLSQSMMEESDDGEMRRRSVCGVVGEQRAKQDRLANEFQAHKEKDLNIHSDISVVVSCSVESDVFEEENEDPACVSQMQRDSRQEDKLHTHTDNRTDNIERAVKQQNDHLPAGQDNQKSVGKTCQDEQNVGRETCQDEQKSDKETRQDEQKSDKETCQEEQKSDRETCQDEEKSEKETCQDEQNTEKQMHQNEQNVEIQNYEPQEEDIQTNCGKQKEEIQSDCNYEKDRMQTGGCKQNIQETETDALQAVTIPGDSHEDEENIQNQQITSETEEQPHVDHVVQEDLSVITYRGQHEKNIHSERQEDDNIVERHTDADKEKAGVQQEVVSDVKIPEEREITDQSNGTKEDNKESEENGQEIRTDERDCDNNKAGKETIQTCEAVLTSSSVDTEPEGSDVQPSKSSDPEHNDSDIIVILDATDGSNFSNSQVEDATVASINSEDGDMHTGISDLNLETSEESKTASSEDTEDKSSTPDNQGGIDSRVSGNPESIEHFETEFGDKLQIKDGSGNLEIKEVQVTAASGNQEGNDMHVTAESDNQESNNIHVSAKTGNQEGNDMHVTAESDNQESNNIHVTTESGNQESNNKHVTTRSCDSESSALESTNKPDNMERNTVNTADGSGNPECTTDGSGNLQNSASAVSAQSPALESPSSITPSKRPNILPSQLRLHSSRTPHPTILCEDTFREPKQTSTDHTHTAKQTNTPTTQSPLLCKPETNSTFKPEITQETQTQPNSDLQTKKSTPKRLGLFRRLRGDTNKNPIPKILIQDFSEKEERLTSKERRRRKREMERKEQEEKERKKREKEMEKDKERQRKKPQTRGKSFQVLNRKCPENNDSIESHTLRSRRNSAPFSDSYF